MTLRALLRLAAGLALALFVVAIWSTPGEAQAGHGAPAPPMRQVEGVPAAKTAAVAVEQAAEPAPQDCGGRMDASGSGSSTCCSGTCHAVLTADLAELPAVELRVAVLPEPPSPAEVAGLMRHIKRPPRPSAAPVG